METGELKPVKTDLFYKIEQFGNTEYHGIEIGLDSPAAKDKISIFNKSGVCSISVMKTTDHELPNYENVPNAIVREISRSEFLKQLRDAVAEQEEVLNLFGGENWLEEEEKQQSYKEIEALIDKIFPTIVKNYAAAKEHIFPTQEKEDTVKISIGEINLNINSKTKNSGY